MTGDFCGTRYGVRLHLAEDTRLCADCATIVTDALTPGVERERRTPTRTGWVLIHHSLDGREASERQ